MDPIDASQTWAWRGYRNPTSRSTGVRCNGLRAARIGAAASSSRPRTRPGSASSSARRVLWNGRPHPSRELCRGDADARRAIKLNLRSFMWWLNTWAVGMYPFRARGLACSRSAWARTSSGSTANGTSSRSCAGSRAREVDRFIGRVTGGARIGLTPPLAVARRALLQFLEGQAGHHVDHDEPARVTSITASSV